jgi:uncharacterized coiled-coil DUF342 family protein
MGAETSGVAGLWGDSGAGTLRPRHDADGTSSAAADAARLRAELEQLSVSLEDMDERIQELVRNNTELGAQLTTEMRLRQEAEQRIQELLAAEVPPPVESTAELQLRQELSLALEELQVVQEELQAAHDALGAERESAPSSS